MYANIIFTHNFLTSVIFTITTETIVLILLLRYVDKHPELKLTRMIASGIFANFATVPYVWYIFPYITNWSHNTSLLLSELFVFVVEALFYRFALKTSWKTSFYVSLICNAVSYLLGPLLRAHGLWIYW